MIMKFQASEINIVLSAATHAVAKAFFSSVFALVRSSLAKRPHSQKG